MATSHQVQVSDPEYHNWVRCVLGLKYTQQGLYPFIDNEVKEFHKKITATVSAQLGVQSVNCCQCTKDNLLPSHSPATCYTRNKKTCYCICTNTPAKRRPCPADVCGRLFDAIVSAHRYSGPVWQNSDMTLWTRDHWEVVKNFLPPAGYKGTKQAMDTDLSGLLSIVINLKDIASNHGIISAPDLFEKCREARNTILHLSSQKLSDTDRDNYIQTMIDVLECTPALKSDQAAQQAYTNLKQVKRDLYVVTDADIAAAKQEMVLVSECLEIIEDKKAEILAQIDDKKNKTIAQMSDMFKQMQKALGTANIGEYQMGVERSELIEEDVDNLESYFNNIDVNQRDDEMNEPDEDGSGLESDDDDIESAGVKTWSALALRSYQLELAENAVHGRNTIICSGTGTGKTWVALYIVEQHFKQATKGPKKAVFIARTVTLVKQQADRFQKYLPDLKSKLVTGEGEDSRKVGFLLPYYDVIFLTPQILINNLENGSVASLREFSLLIIDECHHTKMDEPFNNLMRKYLIEKADNNCNLPQIVGLTASIGVGDSTSDQQACEYIMKMCARLDVCLISTVEKNKEEMHNHTPETSEEIVTMVVRKHDPCKDILLEAIQEMEIKLKGLSLTQPSMIRFWTKPITDKESKDYQKWTVEVMKEAECHVEDPELARDIRSCAMYLNAYNAALEVNSLLQKEDVAEYLANRHKNEIRKKMSNLEREIHSYLFGVQDKIINLNYTNPNLNFVGDTLNKMLQEKGEDSRAIVFVKARATCKSLAKFLDSTFEVNGIKAQHLYGKGNRGFDEGMTEAEQNEAIEMFREGKIKILVSTSVASEGLDIPDCNIVLSYNFSGNEITKIQIKGRSRKKGGSSVVLGSERTVQQEQMNAYKAAMMQRALKTFIEKQRQSPRDIEKKITSFQDEERQKYRFRLERERTNLARKKLEYDQDIHCKRCAVFLCHLSDVRVLNKNQYMVIGKDFERRIEVTPHKSPKMYDGLHKKFKMRCKNCPNELGNVSEFRSLPCRIIKLTSLKFKDRAGGISKTYKYWKDVPYHVEEVSVEGLHALLG